MASDPQFVNFIVDQLSDAGIPAARKMFGDYALYLNGKVIGLICDNKLYIKPTEGGRAFIGDVVEAPAYPGAKNSFFIEDKFEDRDWINELAKITVSELPEPKPKKAKKKTL